MVTATLLHYVIIFSFVLNFVVGEQTCDSSSVTVNQCPPTFTCVPKNDITGYCQCLPGYTKVNDTFCENSDKDSTVKSSSLVEEDNNGSGHIVAGILIPTFLIMVVISGVYFNRKYHLVDYVTSKLYQRNGNYDEVMIGQDLDDDDPPLQTNTQIARTITATRYYSRKMAERKIIGRKSQMFLHSVIPVVNTHEELVKQKFKRGKFTFTITGILKIIGNVLFLTSILIFATNSKCEDAPSWFPYLLPYGLGVHLVLSLLLYIIFCLGLIKNNPGPWVTLDITLNFALSVVSIIACVFSLTNDCDTSKTLERIPMVSAWLCASFVFIIGCGSLFLLYRYKEDEEVEPTPRQQPIDPRKSVFA
ncbi:hypothetical protein FQR65_LT00397 [Abscondita terminalis]|nr:hypothetical protein FQR65_LT00397 [Abscondita terminalis]